MVCTFILKTCYRLLFLIKRRLQIEAQYACKYVQALVQISECDVVRGEFLLHCQNCIEADHIINHFCLI